MSVRRCRQTPQPTTPDTGPLVCECEPPPTRTTRWHGADECARCQRRIPEDDL